ncbi:orotate phosphoribosyltransferase [Catenibacillus scindens]|uniref:Orotate phosphoribosyltransferase n=1 Tax=Catenibacillus scindens TaxID=673271 RepID=A0A7W8H8Y3_9FIRM|nr:orotate phosphoribosyltransferase [Catenibacillus scindens]MBB5264066.1 orotate phosphoribosyltransferase [Catenibacillus scindens]
MESRLKDIRSTRNPKARIKVMNGHFATSHSHVNTYIDMSTVKCRHNNARETAKTLADRYINTTPVDTIICLDGTEVIAAFMAEMLAENGVMSINAGKNISVVTPEYGSGGQIIFRDNNQRMVKNMQVLLLCASTTTGKTIAQAVECINYYGGSVCGIAAIFSAVKESHGLEVNAIFSGEDLPVKYEAFAPWDCPYCKQGMHVEAVINGFGYSKI